MRGASTSTVEPGITTSAALRLKLALGRGPSSQRFWARPDLRHIFPEYLFLVHCIIRASVPLMGAAVAAARLKGPGDAVAWRLADYFSHHITEETAHDEWLLDDMEVLGFERQGILKRVPPPEVAELVGAQYYWLHHAHPVALLGYVAVLEGDPPLEDELASAALRTGISHDAYRTFISHAKLDPNHKQELDDFIDSLSLTDEQQTLLSVSALTTLGGLRKVFATLSD